MTLLAFALTLAGTVLGAIWANREWARFWSWDVKEIGALLTLTWQAFLLGFLMGRPNRTRWLLCWGMLGNVIVTFAWFVTNIIVVEGQLRSYGYPRAMILTLFFVVLATHVLFIVGVAALIFGELVCVIAKNSGVRVHSGLDSSEYSKGVATAMRLDGTPCKVLSACRHVLSRLNAQCSRYYSLVDRPSW